MTGAPSWRFRRMQPGEMNIDPIEGEFFSTEALGSLADALVREAIQNSLDARAPGLRARVRIVFPPPAAMLSGARRDRYLAGLWPHLTADRSGLAELPSSDRPLGFVLFEDFGTRGLQGSPEQSEDEEPDAGTSRNDFYYFWRNVGRSRKSASELGRWGLGKTVFPAASQLNAFFAVTVRRDDGRRLLMGQAVLRIHKLDGARYYPYGYFGRFEGEFTLPVEDAELVDAFCREFGLGRGTEPGLSVVIPHPEPDLAPGQVLPSVVRHYFVPILAGNLVVEVEHDSRTELLDAGTLASVLGHVGWAEAPTLQRLVELAHWGLRVQGDRYAPLPEPSPAAAPRWSADAAVEKALTPLRDTFNRGDPVAVRVPVWVKPASGEPVCASFDVYLERDDALSGGEEHFVRDGITVAGVRSGVQSGVRAIVCVRERALSGLLGDSENPAHTEWQERSPRFKERYRHGPFTLRYVKGAPREIVRILTRPAAGRDFALLRHLFSLDVPTEETVKQRQPQGPNRAGLDGTGGAPAVEAAGKDRFFELQKLQGGFRVAGAGNGARPPRFAAILAAYEVRRGNPFALYQRLDFEIGRSPIIAEVAGAEVVRQERNAIVLRIDDPAFQLVVKGFDPRRDVRVKTIALEDEG
ncbi:MAG: hypothetical protein HYY28_14870 [Betaproteobacteria bacterium]|nr:hypothetical protein [Betaproteobacteria bacterium]MBI2961593.1 hypothetical protein [Betaproteobacteria bacterium]